MITTVLTAITPITLTGTDRCRLDFLVYYYLAVVIRTILSFAYIGLLTSSGGFQSGWALSSAYKLHI